MFAPKSLGRRFALLVAGDFAVSIWAARYAFAASGLLADGSLLRENRVFAALTLTAVSLITVYFQDLYRSDMPHTRAWVASSVLSASAMATVPVGLVAFSIPGFEFGRRFYILYLLVSSSGLVVWRVAVNRLVFDRISIGVMAFGFAEYAPLLAEAVERRAHLGYRFLGFASSEDGRDQAGKFLSLPNHPVSSVDDLVRRYEPDILVLLDEGARGLGIRDLMKCRARGVEVLDFESFYERTAGKLPLPFVREAWLLFAPGFNGSRWQRVIERGFDLVAAAVLGIITMPVVVLAAIAIKLDSHGPVFYSQDRVGLDGCVFRVHKFRSMSRDAERHTGAVWASDEDPRVTRVGRVLRKLRIDELPQLINVMRGDMSLVGPRPERPEIVAKLSESIPYYDYRHFVRPGLTGWAQVCYPYGASVDDAREKLCYDLFYIKNWSLFFDLQIILQTVKVVVFGLGAR